MKPLKDLKITYSPWEQSKWPTERMLDSVQKVLYSEKTHCLYFGDAHWDNQRTAAKFNAFVQENPEYTEGMPPELEKALREYRKKMDSSEEKSKRRRGFVKAVTGGVKLDNVLTTTGFLNGMTEGGNNLIIKGDILKYYGDVLLYRIGPDEFLLGRNLSGGGVNNGSCEARVYSVVAQSSAKFWPSDLMHDKELSKSTSHYVFVWVLQRLRIIQIKYPTAVNHRAEYKTLFGKTCKVLREAQDRWKTTFKDAQREEVQKMIDIFGDIPKMKEYNSALRMRYEMTGEM